MSEQPKFTPGPWEARMGGPSHIEGDIGTIPPHVIKQAIDNEGRRTTAFVATCNATTLPNEANARLIAAAPELYEALADLVTAVRADWSDMQRQATVAEKVLAKARGAKVGGIG